MENSSSVEAAFGAVWIYAFWAAWGLTSIACAYFAYQSTIRRKHLALDIGAYWWAFFTLVGSIWTLLIYWLVEHSTLSGQRNGDPP